ncbi:MAG TPA: DUF4382 domain-containing protein [Chryseosolibacter sp.]
MRVKSLSWIQAILFGCAVTLFTGCDDSDEPMGKGEVEVQITDAPIDDANVKSVVVTVADVKIDGQSLSGFTKTTIDLKAFQDGNTKILGSQTMDAKSYSSMVLVLDLDSDAQGNAPGCYVLAADGAKYKLKSTATGKLEVVANQSWSAVKNARTVVVADFDLRKSIRYSDDPSVRYSFVSDANLNAAVRIVAKEKSGMIKGTYENSSDANPEKIVVYAYKKGTFNAATETQAQGTDAIQFKNAVASASVKESLSGKVYTLAYLPEGEYELVFAGYSKNPESGRVGFEALLKSETSVNGSVASVIRVQANATISISTSIKGLI